MRNTALRVLALSAALIAPVSAQAQTHVYQLNNTLADSYGGPSLTALGGTLSTAGYNFSNDRGLKLSGIFNTGTYASGAYTLIMRFKLGTPGLNGSDGYAKIVDFKNSSTYMGYYNYGDGAVNNGYGATLASVGQGEWDNNSPYSPNLFRRTTLTRTAAGIFTLYINGTKQYSFNDSNDDMVFDQAGGLAQFFVDDNTDPNNTHYADGSVNYIAAYDRAFSAGEVEGYQYDQAFATPEPASVALLATGLIGIYGAARRRRRA